MGEGNRSHIILHETRTENEKERVSEGVCSRRMLGACHLDGASGFWKGDAVEKWFCFIPQIFRRVLNGCVSVCKFYS